MSILPFFSFSSLKIFVSFIFIALFPSWHLALVLFSSLCFNQFCSGRYNFWFPLFVRSIYCTLFLLDCFDFAYGYICICVYSVTLSIVVINLCLYIGLCSSVEFSFFSLLFPFLFCFFLFFLFYIFNFFNLLYFSTFIPLFAFPIVLFPLKLIFNVSKSSLSTSIQHCLSIHSFFPFLSTYLLVQLLLLYSPLGTLLQFCFPVCALVSFILNWYT